MKQITTKQFQMLLDHETVWNLLVENYAEKVMRGNDEERTLFFDPQQKALMEAAAKRGYMQCFVSESWVIDFEDPGTEWNPPRAWQGVISDTMAPPPHSTYEYNVIIADEKGEYVCFSGMWWVKENKLAYMEPLCTIPEYRRRGLASAALSLHYHRMKELGAKCMTGGDNDFYRKIGYNRKTQSYGWKK